MLPFPSFVPLRFAHTAILDLVRIPDAIAQSDRFKGRFATIRSEFTTAIAIENNKAAHKLSTKADLEAIRTWLSPLEFTEEGIKYREHTPKTGEWFLRSQEFVNWRDGFVQMEAEGSCSVLWCPGARK
jgi:hypothetical protein